MFKAIKKWLIRLLIKQFIKTNRIDQIIYESEKEMNEGAKSIDLDDAFKKLSKKYYEEI